MRQGRTILASVLVMLLGVALFGCQQHKPQPGQTPEQLQDRLSNARAIDDYNRRDRALHDIAIDAAASRIGDAAVQAISSISNSSLRDETAEQAAKILEERSDRANAERIVQLISDTNRRDEMRDYLASRAPSTR